MARWPHLRRVHTARRSARDARWIRKVVLVTPRFADCTCECARARSLAGLRREYASSVQGGEHPTAHRPFTQNPNDATSARELRDPHWSDRSSRGSTPIEIAHSAGTSVPVLAERGTRRPARYVRSDRVGFAARSPRLGAGLRMHLDGRASLQRKEGCIARPEDLLNAGTPSAPGLPVRSPCRSPRP